MKRLLFFLAFFHAFFVEGQCDLAITDVNLNTYEVTIEVFNGEGCGATDLRSSNPYTSCALIEGRRLC